MILVEKGNIKKILKVRSLSKVAPVPFPQGLDVLDQIDYLVVCNNIKKQPQLIILNPNKVRKIIHKDSVNEDAYWLQPDAYTSHGMAFEKVFS